MKSYTDIVAELKPIIAHAGDILCSYRGQALTKTDKPASGFATEADLASEKYLINALRQVLPQAGFVAEESGATDEKAEYTWVIDPLDGTTNFAHGLDYFCVSVALAHHDIPVVGMIYHPLTHEVWYAIQGGGAYLNDQPISVTQPNAFNRALIGVGLPYPRPEKIAMMHASEQVAHDAYTIRHLGAIALDLAHVACGRLDGVIFRGLAWWDVAAGMLLVQEAGGIVSDFKGNNITPAYSSCVAGGPLVYKRLCQIMVS